MKSKTTPTHSRRKFLFSMGVSALSIPALSFVSCGQTTSSEKSETTETQSKKKLGVALVGLGNYSRGQLAPALQETENCYLAGIVSGTPSKIQTWKEKYNIPDKNIYNYENFDSIKDNPDIDIVYVVLPNSMHAEYTIRAAEAGKHVICEKPMAITVADCDRMIAACNKAGKKLSIGYRLHFEPYNLEMARLGTQKVFGELTKISSGFGFNAQPGVWRLNKELSGGGPLMDVGIYCIQGMCYVSGEVPIAVTAQEGPKTDLVKFASVEESLTWQFEMPGGLITEGKTSYSEGMNFLRGEAKEGWFELAPAFNYSGQAGSTSEGKMDFPRVNQQALQMDDFAQCINENKPTRVPGEMGRRDVKLLQAIYEAMRTGKRIEIPA